MNERSIIAKHNNISCNDINNNNGNAINELDWFKGNFNDQSSFKKWWFWSIMGTKLYTNTSKWWQRIRNWLGDFKSRFDSAASASDDNVDEYIIKISH